MESMKAFLEMGGYARFVWPAYGLVTAVTLGLLVMSLKTLKARKRALALLQEQMPGRRGQRADI